MNQENQNLSRRKFLAAGSVVVASSLLAVETKAASDTVALAENSKNIANNAGLFLDDPVTTEASQTLRNKKISALDGNVFGTATVNIKEYSSFPTTGTDITAALNWAIGQLNGIGGRILIPAGIWTSSGGHAIPDAVSIEGVGQNFDSAQGSEIKMLSSAFDHMFILTGDRRKCSLKNLRVNLVNRLDAAGLLIQNTGSFIVYGTYVENVSFVRGAYGIKVFSTTGNFECILNRFERVSFIGCRKGFFCNSINGGYSFDTCYFSIPTIEGNTPAGIALEILTTGNVAVEHCLFVGNGSSGPNILPTDGSIILKTVGAFNNISFYNCQDENIQYSYRNTNNNYSSVPLVYRNCLIQSKLKFTADGSVVFDSCVLNITSINNEEQNVAIQVEDSENIFVRVLLNGLNYIYTAQGFTPGKLVKFFSPYSRVIDGAGNVNPHITTPPPGVYQIINSSVGIVTVAQGAYYASIYNNLVTTDSMVFLQLRTYDSGGARIRDVSCQGGLFTIYLTQNAAIDLKVSFEVKVLNF